MFSWLKSSSQNPAKYFFNCKLKDECHRTPILNDLIDMERYFSNKNKCTRQCSSVRCKNNYYLYLQENHHFLLIHRVLLLFNKHLIWNTRYKKMLNKKTVPGFPISPLSPFDPLKPRPPLLPLSPDAPSRPSFPLEPKRKPH